MFTRDEMNLVARLVRAQEKTAAATERAQEVEEYMVLNKVLPSSLNPTQKQRQFELYRKLWPREDQSSD